MSAKSVAENAGAKKSLVGFTAARSGDLFLIHIIDDADEVFEIEASRENIELMVTNLQSLIDETDAASTHLAGQQDGHSA